MGPTDCPSVQPGVVVHAADHHPVRTPPGAGGPGVRHDHLLQHGRALLHAPAGPQHGGQVRRLPTL